MNKQQEEGKLVIIKSYGPIYELGGISGPVTTPSFIPIKKLVQMLNSHKVIFEVNPYNPSETVRLTFTNLRRENFRAKAKPAVNIINKAETSKAKAETKTEPVKTEPKKEDKKLEGDFVKQQ